LNHPCPAQALNEPVRARRRVTLKLGVGARAEINRWFGTSPPNFVKSKSIRLIFGRIKPFDYENIEVGLKI
jgi:hypothetical protein